MGRLSEFHVKRSEIEGQMRSLSSGYRGEKTLNYFLSLLPSKKYHIFQGIRLPIGKSYFQMDAILFSNKSGLIVEGKNYSGEILLDKLQLTRTFKEEMTIYSNPVAQVNRHKILLKYLFEKYQLPLIPIGNLVCFTNKTSSIKITPGYHEAEKKICKADNLLMKIDEHESMV